MKDALDVVVAWQLKHPECSSTEDAIKSVKDHLAGNEVTMKRRSIDSGKVDLHNVSNGKSLNGENNLPTNRANS